MPREEKVIVAFVASPSDIDEERDKLEEVVRELNLVWSKSLRLRVELVRWETHAMPGRASDPQAVINQQLGDEFDIFIGMMWGRFGTPTGRAGSGTEEEFLRAKNRHDAGDGIRLMLYFKDAPLAPSSIDTTQLARVNAFRDSLGAEGFLHWTFRNLEEFESLLRMHLGRQIQQFAGVSAAGPPQRTASLSPDAPSAEEAEGFLELMERFQATLESTNDAASRLTDMLAELGTSMDTHAEEISRLVSPDMSLGEAKKLVNKAADTMDRATSRSRAEIPILRTALAESMTTASRIAYPSGGARGGPVQDTARFWHGCSRGRGRAWRRLCYTGGACGAQVRWPSTTWRKMLAARACCTSACATVWVQLTGARSSTRCFGQRGSRHSRSRMYPRGSIRCMRQLASSDTKMVLISAPSSLPQKSQFRLPTTCRRRFNSEMLLCMGRLPSSRNRISATFWLRA